MSNAHDHFVAHYKAVRLRMGMGGSQPIPVEPKEPLKHMAPGIFAVPRQRAETLRIRKHAAARNTRMRQMLDDTQTTTPPEMFGLFHPISPVPVAEIQRMVAAHFEMTVPQMMSRSRMMNVVFTRQIAIYLARLLTNNSLVVIGSFFGNYDHTTVLHAIRRVEARMDRSDAFAEAVASIRHKLVGNDIGVYYGA